MTRICSLYNPAVAFLAALSLALLPAVAAAQQPAAKNRVVMQVSDNDPGKWNLALNTHYSHWYEWGTMIYPRFKIPVGPKSFDEALASGVRVEACENTMRGQKLAQTDMLNGIGYVPAGVVEIMQKQQQGYAYLRP